MCFLHNKKVYKVHFLHNKKVCRVYFLHNKKVYPKSFCIFVPIKPSDYDRQKDTGNGADRTERRTGL